MKRIKNVLIILGLFAAIAAAIFIIPGTFTEEGGLTGRGIGIVVTGTLALILPFMTPVGGKKDD